MKILKISTLYFLAILCMAIASCSDDDKDKDEVVEDGGTFTLDGTSYDLTKGFLVDEGGQFAIVLTSNGISLESPDGDDFIGTGDFVFISVITSSGTSFDPGTFEWSDDGGPETIEFAEVGVNLDVSGDVDDALEGVDGTATVEISDDTYMITFTIMTDTETITGSYNGPLTDVQD